MDKSKPEDLAVLGGAPAFAQPLHVGRPNLGRRDKVLERINDIFDRRWFTNNGHYVQEFERKMAELLGARHCIAVCNGTVALDIAIHALELTGEVIIPSFTFIATAHALQWQGIKPVFCDVDPATHNLDPQRVAELITPDTSAIMGVHLWGRACDVEKLDGIAQQHNLKLLFDAAHAFACSHNGRMAGNFGQAEVFSFHATKFFNTFEGGAIATNDDDLAQRIRLMKNFGFAGYDNVAGLGTNGKMNEISAAMGLTGLESLDEFIAVNYRNYECYQRELAELPGLRLIAYNGDERNNYQYIIAEIDETTAPLNRDELVRVLHAENVLVRRYFTPGCHRSAPYRAEAESLAARLPQTERLARQVVAFPNGTAVGPAEIATIGALIRDAWANGPALRQRLASVAATSGV